MLSFTTGLVLGAGHAVTGPDHLAAVAPLSTGTRAWRVGMAWGSGHAVGVALVALALWGLGNTLSLEMLGDYGERVVGVSLIAVGLWRVKGRPHASAHRRAHAAPAAAVGLLHGVAGGSHLYAALPVLALADGGGYLLGFALGAIVAMGVFATTVGRLIGAASPGRRRLVERWLGLTTVAVGLAWLLV